MKRINEIKLKENIEKRLNSDIEKNLVGGACVLVKQNGVTVYENAFGVKDHNTNEPLKTDDVFRLASMTKPVTAVATLIQASRGIVGLYDPIEKYLPAYGEMDLGKVDENGNIIRLGKAENKLRVIHFLTHSSGVGTHDVGDKFISMMPKEKFASLKDVVDYHADCPLAFEPNSSQYYSPLVGFDVLARIVEISSGMSYDKFLEKEIFTPLSMNETTYTPSDELCKRLVSIHDRVNGVSVSVENTKPYKPFYFSGGAGLVSTIYDYSKFAEMLLNGGLLPDELMFAMTRPQLPYNTMPGNQIWGLGMRVITEDSYKLLPKNSFGWSGAHGTHFWVDPDNKITAVYMKNSRYDGGAGAVTANNFEEDVTSSLED